MIITFDDNTKKLIKNTSELYYQLLNSNFQLNGALTYSLLIRTQNGNTYLDTLYSLANI